MNTVYLGQIASAALFLGRFAALYVQTNVPDAHRMRKVAMGLTTINAFSYGLQNAWTAATVQFGALVRNAILVTPWGAKNQKLVSVFACAGTVAAALDMRGGMPETMEQTLPLVAAVVGATADLQNQGRVTRAIYATYPLFWLPIRYQLKDIPGAAADLLVTAIYLDGIRKNDIKNAAGENRTFLENTKAYLYGLFNNAATGAKIKGQVEVKPGSENALAQYKRKLEENPNPHYLDRDKRLAELTL